MLEQAVHTYLKEDVAEAFPQACPAVSHNPHSHDVSTDMEVFPHGVIADVCRQHNGTDASSGRHTALKAWHKSSYSTFTDSGTQTNVFKYMLSHEYGEVDKYQWFRKIPAS